MMQKKVAEILPVQAMKLPALLAMQAVKLPALPAPLPPLPPALITPPPPQDQMILIYMALVCLRSLPSVFVYFFGYNTSQAENKKVKKQDKKTGSTTKTKTESTTRTTSNALDLMMKKPNE